MTLQIQDRVKETTTTTGTGDLTLLGAMTGFRAFSAVCSDADTCWYALQSVDGNGIANGDWEVGIGTYHTSANTISRTTVLSSSNSNAAVNLGAGTKQVWIGMPAAKAVDPYYFGSANAPSSSAFTLVSSSQSGVTTSMSNLASGRGFVLTANEGGSSVDAMAQASRSVPAGSSWSIIVLVHPDNTWNSAFSHAGIFVKDAANKMVIFGQAGSSIVGWGNGTYDKWTMGATPSYTGRTTYDAGMCVNAPTWMKLVYNGTTFVFHTSNNGETWIQRFSISSTDFIGTPSTCGLSLDCNQTTNIGASMSCYHYFQG